MKIELSVEDLEAILAALGTDEDKIGEEIKSVENFSFIGTCSRMESRDSYLNELKEALSYLTALSCRLGEILDANTEEEETE